MHGDVGMVIPQPCKGHLSSCLWKPPTANDANHHQPNTHQRHQAKQ